MKLDELKKMIQEEFESYMKEEDVDVSVGADDVDAEMDKNPEDALEQIYKMLQDYFEGDGEDNDMDGVEDEPGEEPMEEVGEVAEGEEELEYNELDRDLLDVDFLQDMLDVVAELDKINALDRAQKELGIINIEGTSVGFDEDTQYFTEVNKGEEIIVLTREVDGVIRITQPIYTNNTIETITDQKPSEITFGDGTGSRITIIQQ